MNDNLICEDLTKDTLFDGEIKCSQFVTGYRFSVDAVLLSHFFKPVNDARIFDCGTGCGIIPLILMYRWQDRIAKISALELQPRLQQLAEHNFTQNNFNHTCSVVAGNICNILDIIPPESYNHTVCNPPYYKSSSGRQSVHEEEKNARHQTEGTLVDFVKGCSAVLKNRGTSFFIYPAELSAELFCTLNTCRLEPKRIQYVYSYPAPGQTAVLIMVECRKNGGVGLQVLPPLYIYEAKGGNYSVELEKYYSPLPL